MNNSQIRDAKNIYWWLWLSPFLLIFTAPFVYGFATATGLKPHNAYSPWIDASAALALGLPHLWLLLPAIIAKSEFVRWHARQTLVIAGIQSLVLPGFLIADGKGISSGFACLGIFVGLLVWLVSNVWGSNQAKRGDCTLMRWFGHGAMLPLPVADESQPSAAPQPAAALRDADALVNLIRFSRDDFARGIALAELRKLGMVEEL